MNDKYIPAAEHYRYFVPISTRWSDNDIYGHINNVVYYSYFDTAVNKFLIDHTGLDIQNSQTIAYVVSTSCEYLESLTYPESIEVGLCVKRIGNSSVTYGLAIFGDERKKAAAHGLFTHVYVDRNTNRPVAIPKHTRKALETLLIEQT